MADNVALALSWVLTTAKRNKVDHSLVSRTKAQLDDVFHRHDSPFETSDLVCEKSRTRRSEKEWIHVAQ